MVYLPVGLGVRVIITLWTCLGENSYFFRKWSLGPRDLVSFSTASFTDRMYSRTPKLVWGNISPIVTFPSLCFLSPWWWVPPELLLRQADIDDDKLVAVDTSAVTPNEDPSVVTIVTTSSIKSIATHPDPTVIVPKSSVFLHTNKRCDLTTQDSCIQKRGICWKPFRFLPHSMIKPTFRDKTKMAKGNKRKGVLWKTWN